MSFVIMAAILAGFALLVGIILLIKYLKEKYKKRQEKKIIKNQEK